MEYKDYLQTAHWKKTRGTRLEASDHCQLCNSKEKLHIHHKLYYLPETSPIVIHRDRKPGSILFDEHISDLLVLCSSCHALWHRNYGKEYPRHKLLSKIRRLIKLGSTPAMAIKLSKEDYAYSVVLNALKKMQR